MVNSYNWEIGVPRTLDFPAPRGPMTLEMSISTDNEDRRADRSYRMVESASVIAIQRIRGQIGKIKDDDLLFNGEGGFHKACAPLTR